MRKKLCIIPSGILNPGSTTESCFELTQAEILNENHDVTIFTVNIQIPLFVWLKYFVKKLLNYKYIEKLNFKFIILKIIEVFFWGIFNRYRIKTYFIKDIKVIEVLSYSFFAKNGFKNNLNHWVKTGIIGFKKYFIKRNEVPHLIMSHGRFLKAGVLAFEIYNKNKIEYTYTEYVTLYREAKAPDEAKDFLNKVLTNSSKNIFISDGIKDDVEKFLNRKVENYKIIPLPVERIYEEKPVSFSVENNRNFVFTNIGYFSERKRQEFLIRAFKKAFMGQKNIILNIIGGGKLFQEYNDLVYKLDLKDVVNIVGYKEPAEIVEILDNSDTFVFPSKSETLGVVIIEALLRGLPVIATICGGPEYILNEILGILIPTDNEEELIKALIYMYNNPSKFDRYKIRKYALKNYGRDKFLMRILPLIDEILSR